MDESTPAPSPPRSGLVLVVGATGRLGSAIVAGLASAGIPTRALVRPTTDAGATRALGVEVVSGDLRDPASLARAAAGVGTVITTANTIGRRFAGERSLGMKAVDDLGNAALIEAAERSGVRRFIFVSLGGPALNAASPFSDAKRRTEERLAASGMESVVVRPDAYQEIWLSAAVGFDPGTGQVTIFGHGQSRVAYVAIPDVAAAIVALAQQPDPPSIVELGGPEALTRLEVVEAFERAMGRPIKRRHVPRPALTVGSVVLRGFRPELASSMAMGLAMDQRDSGLGPEAFKRLGIRPRPVSEHIEAVAREIDGGPR